MCSWRRDRSQLTIGRRLLLAALAASFAVRPASANTLAVWVQMGPNNEQHRGPNVVARAITDDTECPALRADGQPHPMKLRAAPETVLRGVASAHFPVRSCEANVPAHVVGLTFDSKPLPLMRGQPRRIVIIGDTGCRIEHTNGEYYRLQDCNDAEASPATRPRHVVIAIFSRARVRARTSYKSRLANPDVPSHHLRYSLGGSATRRADVSCCCNAPQVLDPSSLGKLTL